MKRLVPIAILIGGLLGVALLVVTRDQPEPTEIPSIAPLVEVTEVVPTEMRFLVQAQGTVVPRTESDLVPQVSGQVVWVAPVMVAGGFFEADDLLVRIDPADYRAAVERARANLARAESEAARAKSERRRQQTLAEQSVASQSRIEDAENAFRVADATLRDARVQLENAERDLSRTEIRAPYAGRVREESVDQGQFVTRGARVARLYAVDYAEVRLPVPDRELRYLDVQLGYRPAPGSDATAPTTDGPPVELRAEFAGREHRWSGQIVRTEGEIDPKSRMVTLVARVEDPYGAGAGSNGVERPPLAVGLFVHAEILGRELPDAVVLPRIALREGDRVLVLDDTGALRFRDVEVLRLERDVVVIGGGLEPGEEVCVTPIAGAIDGMAVRVTRDASVEAAAS